MTHSSPVKSPYTFRLWAAFAIVPFVNAAVAHVCFPMVWAMRGHPGHLADPAEAAFSFGLISGALGLLVTWAGAVPLVGWLAKRGPIALPTALVAGLLLGNAPFGAYLIGLVVPATIAHVINGTMSEHLAPLSELIAGTIRVLVIGSGMGALSGAVFWFIGMYEPGATTRSVLP